MRPAGPLCWLADFETSWLVGGETPPTKALAAIRPLAALLSVYATPDEQVVASTAPERPCPDAQIRRWSWTQARAADAVPRQPNLLDARTWPAAQRPLQVARLGRQLTEDVRAELRTARPSLWGWLPPPASKLEVERWPRRRFKPRLGAAGHGHRVLAAGQRPPGPIARYTEEPELEVRAAFGLVDVLGDTLEAPGETYRIHRQRTDARGRFLGLEMADADATTTGLRPHEREALMSVRRRVRAHLHRLGWRGPFGIDALRVRLEDEDQFLALGEINARMTFGHLAWAAATRARSEHALPPTHPIRFHIDRRPVVAARTRSLVANDQVPVYAALTWNEASTP